MSTLQLSLAIIGGLVLALIVAYNTWTTRRNAPARALRRAHWRPCGRAGAAAPGTGSTAQPGGADRRVDLDRRRPRRARRGPAEARVPVPRSQSAGPASTRSSTSSPRCRPSASVSGDAALAAHAAHAPRRQQTVCHRRPERATQRVGDAARRPALPEFQAGVQLANRTGALNEIEYSEFVVKAQAFADAINAAPDFPDMLRGGGPRPRAGPVRQRRTTRSWPSCCAPARRPGARATCSRTRRASASCPARCPAAWCCRQRTRACRRCSRWATTPQAALAEDPEQSAIRDLTLSLDVAQVPPRRAALRAPARRGRGAVRRPWTACSATRTASRCQPWPWTAIAADLELLYDPLDGARPVGGLGAGAPRCSASLDRMTIRAFRRSADRQAQARTKRCAISCTTTPHQYYVLDAPDVPDAEYDRLSASCRRWRTKHPDSSPPIRPPSA